LLRNKSDGSKAAAASKGATASKAIFQVIVVLVPLPNPRVFDRPQTNMGDLGGKDPEVTNGVGEKDPVVVSRCGLSRHWDFCHDSCVALGEQKSRGLLKMSYSTTHRFIFVLLSVITHQFFFFDVYETLGRSDAGA
jgi:hypothetical protein